MNLNRRVPNGLPGGVRGRKFYYFLLLDCVKMVLVMGGIHLPIVISMSFVFMVLILSVVLSLRKKVL